MTSVRILCFITIICGLPCQLLSAGLGDETLLKTYFQELRSRQLFSVAEQVGMDRLEEDRLSPREEILLSVELSKTYAEHARYTSGDEHEEYWSIAEDILDEALESHRKHPRSLLLDYQRANVPAERGRFLRGQVELFPFDDALRRQAGDVFAVAIERLKAVESQLAQQHRRLIRNRQRGPDDMQTYEIHDLLAETRLQLAVTLQESAKIKPAYDPERTRPLQEASRWLELLSEAKGDQPLRAEAMIHLAENARLRNDLTRSGQHLTELEQGVVAEEIRPQLVAERVRWCLAKGQLTTAEKILEPTRSGKWQQIGELAFLRVTVQIGIWETLGNSSAAENQWEKIQKDIAESETLIGGYWAFRIRQLGQHLEMARKYGRKPALFVRKAAAKLAAGQPLEAADNYEEAARLANEDGNTDVVFDLKYTAASIRLQQGIFPEAGQSFFELTQSFPKNPRVAEANLLWAYCLGRIYANNPMEKPRLDYTAALLSHVKTYPNHRTTGDAYWMLGRHEETRKQNTQALRYFRNIPVDHARGTEAQLGVARCYEKTLKRLEELTADVEERRREALQKKDEETAKAEERQRDALQQKTLEWEAAASEELGQMVERYPVEPEPWNLGQVQLAVQLAHFEISRTTPNYPRADSLLVRVFTIAEQSRRTSAAAAAKTWQDLIRTSQQLRIVSLAGQGLSNRAGQLIEELAESQTSDVLGVMDGLTQVAFESTAATRKQLGQLQLKTALELNRRRDQLSPEQQQRLDHCQAQAYLATGQTDQALSIYDRVLKAAPKQSGLKIRIAQVLGETAIRECLLKAKQLWRELESQVRPGSATWLERRYEVANCAWKLGEREEARKLLGVTNLLYRQQLEKTDLGEMFKKLAQEVNR